MFASDERVFPSGFEDSADKKKTDNKTGNGVKLSAEGRFFKMYSSKPISESTKTKFLVMYLVMLYDRATQIYTRRARNSFVSYLQLFENCLHT